MSEKQVRVTFQPRGRAVFVLPGTKMLEAAARAGMTVETPCGGQGTCGKCRVQVTRGACEPGEAERAIFSEDELADGWRLACQASICEEAVVDVPAASLFAARHRIVTETKTGADEDVLPAVRKVYVELAEPSLSDGAADLLRLEQHIGPVQADLPMLRQVGRLLREGGFCGTAVLTDHRLIDFEPGDTTGECYGAAFDVGTTTVVGSLLDLTTGEELGVASAMNPQVRFGDDVLSRIQYAGAGPEQLEELRAAMVGAVNGLLDELCAAAGTPRERIYEASFAGNTTMQHLLSGIDPTQLGRVPFVAAHGRGLMLPAEEVGVAIHPRGSAYVFPVIGGFVGGDTVAGLLATDLADLDGPVMMVDIGTNGEIVLARDGEIWAASTAAGPAFEGARISCGMRAAAGAIEKVVFDGDVRCSVIGDVEPVGLCGSALVDLAAGLLDAGVVTSTGRMLPPDELPADLPDAIRARASLDDAGQPQFALTGDATVSITQRDIRELQLAAGAIRAGISILLREASVTAGELKGVYLAGGFGSFIRRSHAQRIGLLPSEIAHEKIQYVGNASLSGARWALASTRARKRAEDLARKAKHVELSQDPNFQMEFAEAMIFPES